MNTTVTRNNPVCFWWTRLTPLLLLLLILPVHSKANYRNARSYLLHYAPLAQSLSAKTGIPASVILGIALIESGHGSSTNCRMLRNHFGIKGVNYLPSQGIPYRSKYHSYSSDEASFGHFCTVISRKKYYPKLKGNKNYQEWLYHINRGNYSSAGQVWVTKVSEAIRKHKLHRFDQVYQKLCGSPKFNWLHSNA